MGTQNPTVQIWLATAPVDMRKGFDTLVEVVRTFLQHDPLTGNLFVFRSKNHERLKIVWWDSNGLAIYYKRLARGVFRFPKPNDNEQSMPITGEQLLKLLSGVDVFTRRTA